VCAHGSPSPSPSPAPLKALPPALLATGVPSSLQCYTWPSGAVTQTFDPQSPPCIAGWDDKKGNGGATTKGVNKSTIRVAYPQGSSLTMWPALSPIVDFFNSRFQLYGRKIEIVPVKSSQAEASKVGTNLNNSGDQRADAAAITQQNVFASMDFIDPVPYDFSLPEFRQVLTQHKIISINGGATPPYGTQAGMQAHQPYEWSYLPTFDDLMANVGTVACRELNGHPASHSLDPKIAQTTRKFALMFPTNDQFGGTVPGIGTLQGILQGCGIQAKFVQFDPAGQAQAENAQMNQLKKDGVTTLIFFPTVGSANNQSPMAAAGAVKYNPEWFTIGWNRYLTDVQTSTKSTKQLRTAFGVGVWNKMPELSSEIFYQAYLAGGGDETGAQGLDDGRAFYEEMLLVASGIQEAGPNLTAQTFADGLHQTTFDNPGAGAAPIWQATVGFPNNSISMVQDYTGWWFDPSAGKEIINGSGNKDINTYLAECYSYLGRRWSLDSWPTQDVFYKDGCR
jgi:hypothetical protein